MRRSLLAIAVLVAACYAPEPQPGAPCNASADCPSPLICSPQQTCERDPQGIMPGDASPADARSAANDSPAGAIDVTAGGMFQGDARLATDDVAAAGCGGTGGRDLFFRVVLTAPQVYYFDTFGSAYDTVIRVHRKSCAAVINDVAADACSDDACNGGQSQIAASLPAGESCIVVDERDGAQTGGTLVLRVLRGGRNGRPLARGIQVNTGDTCAGTNTAEPGCANKGAKDHPYFFTTCPGETLKLDADTCPEPRSWDPVLHVERVEGNQLACDDDSCGLGSRLTNVTIANSALYFLYVEGFESGECGPYQLDTNLRP